MKVTKISEEDIYIQRRINYVFELDNKTIRVSYWCKSDIETCDFDFDEEINEKDMARLTEEEQELFQDELNELMFDLKEGEERILI